MDRRRYIPDSFYRKDKGYFQEDVSCRKGEAVVFLAIYFRSNPDNRGFFQQRHILADLYFRIVGYIKRDLFLYGASTTDQGPNGMVVH